MYGQPLPLYVSLLEEQQWFTNSAFSQNNTASLKLLTGLISTDGRKP